MERLRTFINKQGFTKNYVITWWILLVILMLPLFIAAFPGLITYDFIEQISNFINGQARESLYDPSTGVYSAGIISTGISTHHPVIVTLFYGFIANIFYMLGGDSGIVVGVGVCCAIQLIIVDFAIACCICYTSKFVRHKSAFSLTVIVIAVVLPIVQIQTLQVGKDGLFGAFFLLFILCVFEIVETKGHSLNRPCFFIGMLLLALLCALTRNIGGYIIFFSMLIICFVYRHQALKLLFISILPILCSSVLVPVCVTSLGGYVGDSLPEALNTAFQQTARYTIEHENEQTESDIEGIDMLLIYDRLAENYTENSTDTIKKKCYRTDHADGALLQYLSVYISEGIDDPACYLAAIWGVASPFFDFSEYAMREEEQVYDIDETVVYELIEEGILPESSSNAIDGGAISSVYVSDSELLDALWEKGVSPRLGIAQYIYPEFSALFEKIDAIPEGLYATWTLYAFALCDIPIVNILMSKSFYAIGMLILILALLFINRKDLRVAIIPIIFLFMTLMISPLACSRYLTPFIFASPAILGAVVDCIINVIGNLREKQTN